MKKLAVVLLSVVFLAVFSNSAIAAPSNLMADPFSSQENDTVTDWGVELSWDKGDTQEAYNVWLSKNGLTWEKVAESVSENTYKVGKDKIDLYVNYYFIVSLNDPSIVNPLTDTNIDPENPNATGIAYAFPPGGGVHGNYKNNTNACAKCHRTHDAAYPSLLITQTVNDTCITCHDGTQSKYDVIKGEVKTNSTNFLSSASGAFGSLGLFSSYADIKLAAFDTVSAKYTVADKSGPWLSGYKATTPKQYWTKIYVVPKGSGVPNVITSTAWKYNEATAWNEILQVNYEAGYVEDAKNLIDPEVSDVYIQFSTALDKDNNTEPDTIPGIMSLHSMSDGIRVGDALKTPIYDGDWGKAFGCGSCHKVHGTQNTDGNINIYVAGNYRLFTGNLPGNSNINVLAFAESQTDKEKINYRFGMTGFCVGCHQDYYTETTNSVTGETYGTVIMGKGENPIQHSVGVSPASYLKNGEPFPLQTTLPLEGTVISEVYQNENKIMCLTCHVGHGSKNANSLLRLENNGVCVDCHQ